jgi:hypothetical protein
MRRSKVVAPLTLAAIVACLHTSTAGAQDSSALINEALDKPVKLAINTELPTAMSGIARETGVRIEADRKVWDLLPWGQQTKVTATIENQSLRDALNAIAHKLGLETVLREQVVELRPMPALTRLGRRSTVQELQALDLLSSTPLNLKNPSPTIRDVVNEVDRALENMKSPFSVEFRPGDAVKPDQAVAVPRNATMAEALESLVKDTGLTWYPWADGIVVVPKEVQVRNQLGKTLTTRYNNADVAQVLTELAQQSGVEFSIEPGAIQRVAPEFRRITLSLDNATVRDALENVSGFTGLAYKVDAKGVYVWNQNGALPAAAAAQQERSIGMIQLDNGVQIFLRPSDLDDDVRQYLEFRRKREIEKLREMMKEEGFKPTPAPSTAPTQPAAPPVEPKRDL